jgi:hemolysin-activating ACP:hemolysin acyltransferase
VKEGSRRVMASTSTIRTEIPRTMVKGTLELSTLSETERSNKLLFDALGLWTRNPVYGELPSKTIAWRLLTAVRNNKIKVFYEGKEPYAFVTWAFFTEQERVTGEYWGEEVFARTDGSVLKILDMVAYHSVLYIGRQLYKYFKDEYPHVRRVYAKRGNREAWYDIRRD